MSAAVLLARARASGVALSAHGAKLRWRAPAPPPPDLGELLGLLRDHKPDVLRALRGGWFGSDSALEAPPPAAIDAPDASTAIHDASWWRELFEERGAIREHDGGFSRTDAEAGALADCVARWRVLNPLPASGDDACVHCCKERPDTPVLALGGRAWLHRACWVPMDVERRETARTAVLSALADMD